VYPRAVNAPPPYQPPPPQQPYPPAQGYAPPPVQAPRPPKKSGGKGCLIALAVVGGIVLLVGAVGAFFVYRFANSPDGKKIVSAVASGASLVATAATAPGTNELRALGCKTAMVFDAADLEAIANTLGDGGTAQIAHGERLAVACATGRGATAPTCDQVAAAYIAAVGRATGPLTVRVGANGESPTCEEMYSATGDRISHNAGGTAH
jgi:hypothetical protein